MNRIAKGWYMDQKPSVGRIVHYKLAQHDVVAIDRQHPMIDANGQRTTRNPVSTGDVYPAMVVHVFAAAECANLQVFLDGDCSHWATSAPEGDEPGQWSWPPRV